MMIVESKLKTAQIKVVDFFNTILLSSFLYLYLFFQVILSFVIAFTLKNKYLLIALDPIFFFPVFIVLIYRKNNQRLISAASFWGICKSILLVVVVWSTGSKMDFLVMDGVDYHVDTLNWIIHGEGTIAHPEIFSPAHILRYFQVIASSIFSFGFVTLVEGAYELNLMNFHVGKLLQMADNTYRILLFGWPIWSLLRGWAYLLIILGTAPLLLSRVSDYVYNRRLGLKFFLVGTIMAFVDLGLKILFAPLWRQILETAL